MSSFPILILVFMLLTLAALGFGLVSMVVGGKMSEKYSNKMMFLRVAMQAAAVLLIGLMFLSQ